MPVRYELVEDIGIVSIDNPPVNALSQDVRLGLQTSIRAAAADASKAIVIVCKGRTFVAGADIREFGKPPAEPWLPELLNEIEASKKPVIAALHGTALGGGLELALASHYRIALASASIGFPEVKLGLLPGAGGTQRTPRLSNVTAALDMMTSGAPVSAQSAHELGLVDEIVERDIYTAALAYARKIVARGKGCRRASDLPTPTADPTLFADYRRRLAERARGQVAPQKIVDCIEASVMMPFPEAMQKEREAFMKLLSGPQSAAMRHVFFAERTAARVRGLAKDTPVRDTKKVAVIGAGTMGSGIAMNFAGAGFPVTLLDVDDEVLARGLAVIDDNYAGGVRRGKLSEPQAKAMRKSITGTTNYADLADADLVIEAVFENLSLKQDVFQSLDDICKPGAILATNTSYQDVDRIAAATRRPEDVIGLHFFSPAHIMKLLEIVRAEKTSDEVLATCLTLAKKIRKIAVVARVCYGFIGNRMLSQYAREAQLCLIEGSTPDAIDIAMQQWGMAMGPMRVFDLAGLDVGYKARKGLPAERRGDPKSYRIPDALVEMGRLGQKSGAGFYTYDKATRDYSVDEQAIAVIEREAHALGVERREIDASEIVDRLIFALINEGLKIVDEGIAERPSDIDVVYVHGYGFPVHRGGPMYYADTVGLAEVHERISEFRDRFGAENWTPSPLLEKLVEDGMSLSDWAAARG